MAELVAGTGVEAGAASAVTLPARAARNEPACGRNSGTAGLQFRHLPVTSS